MNLNSETKRKLREMAAGDLLTAFESQDDVVSMSLSIEARIELAVDQARGLFLNTKPHGLIRRAKLRYPQADLRKVDRVEERGLNQPLLAQLATCHFIELNRNLVFQGFTGQASRIWRAPWRSRPVFTATVPDTCGCRTSKKNGSRPPTSRWACKSCCAGMPITVPWYWTNGFWSHRVESS